MREEACQGDVPFAGEGTTYAWRRKGVNGSAAATLYAFGGQGKGGELTSDVHAMDCETRVWTRLVTKGTAPTPRAGSAMTISREGHLFVHGGVSEQADRSSVYLADAHELNLSTMTWREVKMRGNAPSPRAFHTLNALNKMMVCFGGDDGTEFKRETHYMRYEDEVWCEPETAGYRGGDDAVCWPCERACHTATALRDGDTLIVFGGLGKNSVSLGDMWAFSASELCWTPVEPPSQTPDERFLHTSTLVDDGLVILGGMTLNMDGAARSGKKYRVFDHMYILTGMQLLTHPLWRAENVRDESQSTVADGRKKFALSYPERVPPKKKLTAKIAQEMTPTPKAAQAIEEVQKEKPAKKEVAQKEEPARKEVAQKDEPAKKEVAQKEEPAKKEVAQKEEPAKKEVAQKEEPAKACLLPEGIRFAAAPKYISVSDSSKNQSKANTKKSKAQPKKKAQPVKVTTKEITTQAFEVSGTAISSRPNTVQIPLPGVKLAPPDDEDEAEAEKGTKDDVHAVVALPPQPVSAKKNGESTSNVASPPKVNDTSPDSTDRAKTNHPLAESPSAKQKQEAATKQAKARLATPGVRLAPLDDEEWDAADLHERMPSFDTSSEQDRAESPESDPWEWVKSEDKKFDILMNRKTGKEIRRIRIPESLQIESDRRTSTTSPVAPTPEVARPRSSDAAERSAVAQKLFETYETTNFAEKYQDMDSAQIAKALAAAWRELPDEERTYWLDTTRGPPSSRKRKELAEPVDTAEDTEFRARAQRTSQAQADMMIRAEMQYEAGLGDFKGGDVSCLGRFVAGVIDGGFDAGYFATVRLEGEEDDPRDYRAVLFSPVLCSQRVVTTAEGEQPMVVLPSYCVPGASGSVARNIVFTRSDEATGATRADSVWGRPLAGVPNVHAAPPVVLTPLKHESPDAGRT